MQRGDSAQGWAPGGDSSGVLQLRLPQCLPPRLHPCQGRLSSGAAVQVRGGCIQPQWAERCEDIWGLGLVRELGMLSNSSGVCSG